MGNLDPTVIGGLVTLGVVVGAAFFLKFGKSAEEKPAAKKEAPAAAKADKKKDKKKEAAAAAPAAPAAVPAPAAAAPKAEKKKEAAKPVEEKKEKKAAKKEPEAPAPAPVADDDFEEVASSKKKKGKKAAAPAPAPVVEAPKAEPKKEAPKAEPKKEAPKAEPKKEAAKAPEAPKAETKKETKKAAEAPKAAAAAAAAPVAAPVKKVAASPEDEEWEEVGGASKKKGKGKAAPALAPSTAGDAPNTFTFTYELGSNVSAVIGKGGQTISSLQNTTGAKITIAKGASTAEILGSREAVDAAKAAIQAILLGNKNSSLKVAAKDAMSIIGKGGENIKAIEKATNARVNVQKVEGSEESNVSITGNDEQIAAARALVAEYIQHKGPKPETTTTMKITDRQKFTLLGGKGALLKSLQASSGARIELQDNSLTVLGDSSPVFKCIKELHDVFQAHSHSKDLDLGEERGKIGAVLGKGGENIKAIQAKSGANIDITKVGNSNVLKISGTVEAIDKAEKLVNETIAAESGPPKPKAGEVLETIELGSSVGSVIGKQGANIKRLTEATGAQINMGANKTVCYIIGKKDAVAKAKAEIDAIVEKDKAFAASRAAVAKAPSSEWVPSQDEGIEPSASTESAGGEGAWGGLDSTADWSA